MSKITQALEKAARERLLRRKEHATAPDRTVTVQLTSSTSAHAATVHEAQVDPHIITVTNTKSPITEQYRMLKANLQSLRGHGGEAKALAITSALHGEGKSVTTLNLALTLARDEELKVLLIDADMRKSTVNRWLGLEDAAEGLSTVLARGGLVDGSLFRLTQLGLTILPAGPVPEDPVALLESAALRKLLAGLRNQFDVILIDTPPVLSVADPVILASQVDGTIFVMRAGKTQRKTILHAVDKLQQMKAGIIGSILTHVAYYQPGYYHYYREYAKEQQRDVPASAALTN